MNHAYHRCALVLTLGLTACVTTSPTPPPPSATPQEAAPIAEVPAPAKAPMPALSVAPSVGAPPPAEEPGMVGGYTSQDVASPAMQSAAAEAIALLKTAKKDRSITLVALKSAATQVVAGQNIRMTLDVTTAAGPRTVTVVLYKDLSGHAELTSIEGL